MMNRTRSTTKLTVLMRCGVIAALAGIALLSTGCAANASRKWAQTAPVIAPEPGGATIVSLSTFDSES